MSRGFIAVLGLVTLALFLLFSVERKSTVIEADLSSRAKTALELRGFDWASIVMDGRELRLNGIAPSAELRDNAEEIVDVRGIRTIDNQLRLATLVLPSTTAAASGPAAEAIELPAEFGRQHGVKQSRPAAECEDELQRLLRREPIRFESGSAVVRQESEPLLRRLSNTVVGCPGASFKVGGHTDSQGAALGNLKLSRERAITVVDFMLNRGVDPARLTAVGYGEERPIADNATASGRAKNRRIEISAGSQ